METFPERAEEQRILREETFSGRTFTVKETESHRKPTWVMDWEGVSWLLEGLIIKPKDSRRARHWNIDSYDFVEEESTKRMSSIQAEFLNPLILR